MARSHSQKLLDTYDQDAVARALSEELRTTHGVFFHQRKDVLTMVTAHAVTTDGEGVPVVGPGRPLTPEDEQALLDLLMGREQREPIEILPPSVLYRDRHATIWWMPPMVRPMHLRRHGEGLETIVTRWPSIVALVRNRSLYLAAVDGDQRPTASSPLYHAPLPNVYASTAVCTGSARLPLAMRISDLEGWESVIFDTAFTHTNHQETLRPQLPPPKAKRAASVRKKPAKPTVVHANADYWAGRAGETQPFPDGSLNPLGLTLAEWLPALGSDPIRPRNPRRGRN